MTKITLLNLVLTTAVSEIIHINIIKVRSTKYMKKSFNYIHFVINIKDKVRHRL